jgi:hypothetical protein
MPLAAAKGISNARMGAASTASMIVRISNLYPISTSTPFKARIRAELGLLPGDVIKV